ncbi:MAG: hypothetical protein AAFY39_03160 [Pseudomonadota bacterium]
MAYVTQSETGSFWSSVRDVFAAIGRGLTVSASADLRMRRIDMLNAKTDAELAAMNLRREDIPAYVFRDLMHI